MPTRINDKKPIDNPNRLMAECALYFRPFLRKSLIKFLNIGLGGFQLRSLNGKSIHLLNEIHRRTLSIRAGEIVVLA